MTMRIPALSGRLLLAASMIALASACAKKEEAPAAPAAAEPAVEAVAEPEAEPMAEAAGDISALVTVTMTNGAPAFGSVSEGACDPSGTCVGGIDLNAAGNVDLTAMPAGDVTITVSLDSSVTAAGYSFPSDPYQAVAIVIIPAGTVTAPIPVFGQANWPAEFDAPSVTSATLTFVDKGDDQQAYEYSIQLMRTDGSMLVMDPRITNSGSGGNN